MRHRAAEAHAVARLRVGQLGEARGVAVGVGVEEVDRADARLAPVRAHGDLAAPVAVEVGQRRERHAEVVPRREAVGDERAARRVAAEDGARDGAVREGHRRRRRMRQRRRGRRRRVEVAAAKVGGVGHVGARHDLEGGRGVVVGAGRVGAAEDDAAAVVGGGRADVVVGARRRAAARQNAAAVVEGGRVVAGVIDRGRVGAAR